MFSIYHKEHKIHLNGNRAFEYLQSLSVKEVEEELASCKSWHGAVMGGATTPVDCSESINVLENELAFRKTLPSTIVPTMHLTTTQYEDLVSTIQQLKKALLILSDKLKPINSNLVSEALIQAGYTEKEA